MELDVDLFTQLGCVVSLLGVVFLMGMNVADEFGVSQYTLNIVNISLLCFIVFPSLVVLIAILLKHWVRKMACGRSTNMKYENLEDTGCTDCVSCWFCSDLFTKNRNYDPDHIPPDLKIVTNETVMQKTKNYESFSQTSNAPTKSPRKSNYKPLTTEEVFRKHFNLEDPVDPLSNANKIDRVTDLKTQLIPMTTRGSEGEVGTHKQVNSKKNPTGQVAFTSTSRKNYIFTAGKAHESESGSTVSVKPDIERETQFGNRGGDTNNRDTPKHAGVKTHKTTPLQTADSGRKFDLEQLPVNSDAAISKDVTKPTRHLTDHQKRRGRENSPRRNSFSIGVESENDKLAEVGDNDHDDSDSSQVLIEELFRQYFGLQNPESNVAEYKRMNADLRKSSISLESPPISEQASYTNKRSRTKMTSDSKDKKDRAKYTEFGKAENTRFEEENEPRNPYQRRSGDKAMTDDDISRDYSYLPDPQTGISQYKSGFNNQTIQPSHHGALYTGSVPKQNPMEHKRKENSENAVSENGSLIRLEKSEYQEITKQDPSKARADRELNVKEYEKRFNSEVKTAPSLEHAHRNNFGNTRKNSTSSERRRHSLQRQGSISSTHSDMSSKGKRGDGSVPVTNGNTIRQASSGSNLDNMSTRKKQNSLTNDVGNNYPLRDDKNTMPNEGAKSDSKHGDPKYYNTPPSEKIRRKNEYEHLKKDTQPSPRNLGGYSDKSDTDNVSLVSSRHDLAAWGDGHSRDRDKLARKPREKGKRLPASPITRRQGRRTLEVDSDEEMVLMVMRRVKTKYTS